MLYDLFKGHGRVAMLFKDIRQRAFPLKEDANDNPHLNTLLTELEQAEFDQSQLTEFRKKA